MVLMSLSVSISFAATTEQGDPVGKVNFSERINNIVGHSSASEEIANLPKVAVIYLNNAKTTYDEDIDQLVIQTIVNSLPTNKYVYVDGAPYVERLAKNGIIDLTTAERQDIVDTFSGEDVDYVVYIEVQPLVTKDKVTFFTVGKDITAIVPLKIIDLLNGKYLYNGKFTEKASDSSMIGGIGNKSVSIKAMKKINEQIESVLATRLPETKPVVRNSLTK